jgi:hypothetical protein
MDHVLPREIPMTDDDAPQVIVCQGPPRCDKECDDAVAAAQTGCVWCERHTLKEDGSWAIQKPAEA